MNIEKLFWSKAKADILKYLVFRRQWVSMRALEAELWWTFPAIKKQIDVLDDCGVVVVDKSFQGKWSISIDDDVFVMIKEFFLFALRKDLADLFNQYSYVIQHSYLGKIFGYDIETDVIIVYQNCEKETLDVFKSQVNDMFRKYGIESVYITLLSTWDWQKRLQLADKFVLNVLRIHRL